MQDVHGASDSGDDFDYDDNDDDDDFGDVHHEADDVVLEMMILKISWLN